MSADQEFLNLAVAESENQTLFDELARLVPAERQAEYYRVIAHTRTLSPNDEMLRVLEAMGILALLTRETPAEIAAERKSLRKILESSASQAIAVEKRMARYASHLESRLIQLPTELETGLDPPRIAKLLGESLRQCFQQSGLPDKFRSVEEMDQTILERLNASAEANDILYFLGDFCIGSKARALEHRKQVRCRKIFALAGNHYKEARKLTEEFSWLNNLAEISIHGQPIVLCHYAMRVWNRSHHGAWHLYGHSHGNLPDTPTSLSMDVGVDTHDFRPWHFDEINFLLARGSQQDVRNRQ
jgi:calcineurin-like phosphoesterase family protein